MNAIPDAQLLKKVRCAWRPTSGNRATSRLPLLAPFITNAMLFRVRNMLVPIVPALQPSKWNKDYHNAWRYDPRDVPRLEVAPGGARAAQSGSANGAKRQRRV